MFDSSGTFKNYLDIELSQNLKDSIQKLIFFDDGSFCTVTSKRVDWKKEGSVYVTKEQIVVKHFKKDGKLNALVFKDMEDGEVAHAPRWGGPNLLFKPRIKVKKTPDGNLVVGKTDENEFRLYNKNGKKTGTIKLAMKKMLLSDSEFEDAKSELVGYYREGSRMKWLAKRMIKLKYKPIYDDFYVTKDYFIIINQIREKPTRDQEKTKLTLYDKQGTHKAILKVDGILMNLSNNRLFIKILDEEENESFRIEMLKIGAK
jgi:hypothetical protein